MGKGPICSACAHESPQHAAYCEECGGELARSFVTCAACAHEGRPGAKHCTACGRRLPRPPRPGECATCAEPLRPGDRFCSGCGAARSPVSAAHSAPAHPASPVAERHAASAPDEERKLVTVLFGDVTGFTAMSEKLDLEEVRDIMDRCFEVLTREITSRGGTIDKLIGDAVMAYFGVPIAHEDDAPRAVRAALAMQKALARFSEQLDAEAGLRVSMRIGLNTGKVLAGHIGSEGHSDFTIYGDTVNTASRLEHAAEPGTILISHSTSQAVRGWFELVELALCA